MFLDNLAVLEMTSFFNKRVKITVINMKADKEVAVTIATLPKLKAGDVWMLKNIADTNNMFTVLTQ